MASRGDGLSEKSTAAQILGDLAIEMQAQRDGDALPHGIASAAVHIVPGTSWQRLGLGALDF